MLAKSGLLVVFFADRRHCIGYGQAQSATVDVRRCPDAALSNISAEGEELVVVAHLRNEILSIAQLSEASSIGAS